MTSRSSRATRTHTVDVVVVVSHDQLRVGEAGEVELDDRVRNLLEKGYLRLADTGDPVTGRPLGETPAALLGVVPAEVVTDDGAGTDPGRPGDPQA